MHDMFHWLHPASSFFILGAASSSDLTVLLMELSIFPHKQSSMCRWFWQPSETRELLGHIFKRPASAKPRGMRQP